MENLSAPNNNTTVPDSGVQYSQTYGVSNSGGIYFYSLEPFCIAGSELVGSFITNANNSTSAHRLYSMSGYDYEG